MTQATVRVEGVCITCGEPFVVRGYENDVPAALECQQCISNDIHRQRELEDLENEIMVRNGGATFSAMGIQFLAYFLNRRCTGCDNGISLDTYCYGCNTPNPYPDRDELLIPARDAIQIARLFGLQVPKKEDE